MEKKTIKDHDGTKHPTDTADAAGAAYAPHDQEAKKLAKKAGTKQKPDENAGDARTPEKTIGEINTRRSPIRNRPP